MKTTALIVLMLTMLSSVDGAPRQLNPQKGQKQQKQQNLQPPRANRGLRPAAQRALLHDAVYRFYVRQFQQDGEVSPDVLKKMLPFLDQFLQDRFEISERRIRTMAQIRQAVNRNGSDEDLNRLVRDLDATDAEFLANHQQFLSNVDPLLNDRQRAKVRLLQTAADNRIRQTLDALQNPNAQRQGNAADTQEK
jgi:hypothetical protein